MTVCCQLAVHNTPQQQFSEALPLSCSTHCTVQLWSRDSMQLMVTKQPRVTSGLRF